MFIIKASSGVIKKSSAKTLAGAKKEATQWAAFGAGNIYIEDEHGTRLCQRRFWSRGNKFGWEKWEQTA